MRNRRPKTHRDSISARILSVLLCLFLTTGCSVAAGEADDTTAADEAKEQDIPQEIDAEEPELVEPVGSILRYIPAEFREISRVSVYQGVVCPDTTEYAYSSLRPFGNYNALPGEPVHTGDVLFYGAAFSVDDEIEAIEEENTTLVEQFMTTSADLSADLVKARKTEFEAADAWQKVTQWAPDENSPGYAGWAKGAMPTEKRYEQAKIAREKLEQSLKETQEQFDIEKAYNEKRIARLVAEKNAAGVSASADGVVVAAAYHLPGDTVADGTPILAVGNPAEKEILSEYVSASIVNRAVEIYALIEGDRYDLQYEVMEADEYRRRKQKGEDVYTTFHLSDPDDMVSLGASAVIVIVEERTLNALSVPRDAVNKDERGSFVYLYENGDSVYTPVQTGAYDPSFIEITSGLKEGDPVIYDPPYNVGNRTLTLEKGEVTTPFTADGYLYYPSAQWSVNPAKTGTCYLNELLVHRSEQVEKGQVLARIEIVSDDIEIARIRRKIDRQNARLADLNTRRAVTYNKDELETIDRSIRDRKLAIESLNRQLEKLTRYTGIYELTAPENGIVTDVTERKAGELIDYREQIAQVARDDSCYIIVEDKDARLSFGDEAKITIRSNAALNEEKTIGGTVVSLSPWGLSNQMRTGYALVRVSQKDMEAMADVTGSNSDNGYWSRSRFGVEVTARHAKDVVLIPKKAVYTSSNNETFVIAKKPDGSTRLVRFEAGGSDAANYWAAYGDVTEGMEICSE